ncbi:cobalamin-dependent protein [Dehalobacterium formicoaceticum]|uniref:Cobalamin-dependent protein n=1 Tax=Dehalobacterium formicoaceticum TaxID=51515 RepID=A0ABT1Y0X8_9FIRM|nr:cobalamin-dependent protein [Dehalobacterium formicoaceticum]MCR6544520.1 cobalamin-dependent protein [Dehalobacterium formicoaceticum]
MEHQDQLICRSITQAVLSGLAQEVINLINRLREKGMNDQQILLEGLTPALKGLSERYCDADYSVPHIIVASRAASAGLAHLKISPNYKKNSKTILLGTVKNDFHSLSKDLVSLVLECHNFKVIDLGVNVSAAQFMDGIKELKPEILGMSALLTSSMGEMAYVINALHKNNLRHAVKIIVGGCPVTKAFAESIGADTYAENAQDAPKKIDLLFNTKLKSFLEPLS